MIEIRTLGRTSVTVAGAELSEEAAWPMALALMVYVAREPGPVRRDELLALLWPDREEKRARHALNQLLYTLRKTNPELDLESLQDEVGFGAEVWIDVQEFERRLGAGDLEGAVQIYGGHFLTDLAVDVPEFDHWADRQRAELQRRFRKTMMELAERAKKADDHERALAYCRRLVELDPLDDEAQHALIECLDRSGDRVGALRQYERYEKELGEALEVEPLDHTKALLERIRRAPTTARQAREIVSAAEAAQTVPGRAPAAALDDAAAAAPSPHLGAVSSMRAKAAQQARRLAAGARSRRARPVEIGAALLLIAAAWFWRSTGGETRTAASPSASMVGEELGRIAVLPFESRGVDPDLDDLATGMAQLLALNLDGMGPLRTVDHRSLLKKWESEAERGAGPVSAERARTLALQLGATSVLLGTLHQSGDQARLTADLLGASSGALLSRVDVRGLRDSLFSLVDQLTLDLVDGLWGSADLPAPRIAARGTASLAALKHYLRAEEHYRGAEWGEAMVEYRKALQQDSTFVPALRALAETILWAAQDPRPEAAQLFERARRLAIEKGASERDRLFDVGRFFFTVGDGAAAVRAFEALAARYPDDFSIQYQLADAYFHFGPRVGIPLDVVDRHFEVLLKWDTAFAPAMDHLWWTAMWRGHERAAREWAVRYARSAPLGTRSAIAPVATSFRYGDEEERRREIPLLERLPSDGSALVVLALLLGDSVDPERAREVASALWEMGPSLVRKAEGAELRAAIEFAMGRPDAAYEWLANARRVGLPDDELTAWQSLSMLYRLAEGRLETHDSPARTPPQSGDVRRWVRDTWLYGAVGLRMGDRESARIAAERLASLADSTPLGALADGLAAGLRAELALAALDTATGLTELRRSVQRYPELALLSEWETVPYYRYRLAQIEAQRRRASEAAEVLRSLGDRSLGDVLYRPRMHLALGAALEQLGKTEEAASHYEAALSWWADPEPSFADEVAQAQAGLRRTGTIR